MAPDEFSVDDHVIASRSSVGATGGRTCASSLWQCQHQVTSVANAGQAFSRSCPVLSGLPGAETPLETQTHHWRS
ncbi:hypothetical protein BaRGS_00022545 [Batillaria attramentaria]|uniref:Uncharacterized protein n=1 Tax=Batillaria attramentaria TaxID=370345 RepID=A0ABD0KGI9_9CAEN